MQSVCACTNNKQINKQIEEKGRIHRCTYSTHLHAEDVVFCGGRGARSDGGAVVVVVVVIVRPEGAPHVYFTRAV